eukprot:6190643-Pleurochrysis_carterae.AAC.4
MGGAASYCLRQRRRPFRMRATQRLRTGRQLPAFGRQQVADSPTGHSCSDRGNARSHEPSHAWQMRGTNAHQHGQ